MPVGLEGGGVVPCCYCLEKKLYLNVSNVDLVWLETQGVLILVGGICEMVWPQFIILESMNSLKIFLLSCNVCQFKKISMLVTLLVLRWRFRQYLAAQRCTDSSFHAAPWVYGSQTQVQY